MAKVIVLSEALGASVAPLRSAQLALCEIITHSDEEKVAQSLCLVSRPPLHAPTLISVMTDM